MVATTFLAGLSHSPVDDLFAERTDLEAVDARYSRLHWLVSVYFRDQRSHHPSSPELREYLPRADEVFQAFAAYAVAEALGLTLAGETLRGGSSPAFVGPALSLQLNSGAGLKSWRAGTSRPDNYRPDVVLRHEDGRVAVLDAKYNDELEPSGDQIKEVQAYMNAYGLGRVGVLFLADTTRGRRPAWSEDITDGDHLIRLIAVGPTPVTEIASASSSIASSLADLFISPEGL